MYNIGYNINNNGPNILNCSQNHSKKTKLYADEFIIITQKNKWEKIQMKII